MDRKLNVMFVPTCSSAVMHWRMQSFVIAAFRTGAANFVNPLWLKDWNHSMEWQKKITDGDTVYMRSFVPMIESGCVNADAVVFQYPHEEGAYALFDAIKFKFPLLPLLTEIDDNILSIPPYNEAYQTYDPRAGVVQRALKQIEESDGVIVSTPYLKEIFSEFNKNLWVIPNSLDFKTWDRLKRQSKPGIRIGWAGGGGREGDVALIENAIKNTLKKHPEVKFVFVNGPALKGLPDFLKGIEGIEHKAVWEPILRYPRLLASMDFDIIISPMVDSAFNRGKSNIKFLEAAALGIPVIASNVGHFKDTLTTGKDCVLCDDEQEFELALDVLIRDRKRRLAIGAAASEKARKDFNIENTVLDYISHLKEVIRIKGGDLAGVRGKEEAVA